MNITASVVAEILAHAHQVSPDECCGLLIGDRQVILRSVRTRNIAADPSRRFLIDPSEHFAAIRLARAEAQEVVGAYHSHPASEAAPSPTDVAEASHGADFVHLIVAPAANDVHAYRIDAGIVREESLIVFA